MNNVTITHTPTISLALTADQWALYHISGRDQCAHRLNRDVAQAINEALGAAEAREAVGGVLDSECEFGADDTEGRYVMEKLLSLAYPHQD